jgi:hypothetical protein
LSDSVDSTKPFVEPRPEDLPPSERRSGIAFGALVLLFAFAVLSAWHFYHGARADTWLRPPLPHGDGPDYESIAYSLSVGDGFQFAWRSEAWQKPYREDPAADGYSQLHRLDWPGPTASRPPLYPAWIALIYSFVPRGPIGFATVRGSSIVCTALAGALAVWGTLDVTRRITDSRWVPFLAAGATLSLAMLDRTIRTYSVDFLTEPLAMLLCTCVGLCGVCWKRDNRMRRWLWLLSLAVAALILTRSMMIFWLPGLAILVAVSSDRGGLRWTLLFVIVVVACLAPWWIRNCIVLERWMPLGGQGAASLCGGYSDEAFADRGNWDGRVEEQLQRELDAIPGSQGWSQAQREVALADRALAKTRTWITTHPTQVPALMAMRVASHWGPFTGTSLLWRVAIVTGWIGLALLRRPERVWILGLPAISTVTIALLYETGGRFLVPLYALLYLTAGIGVGFVLELARQRWFALRRN